MGKMMRILKQTAKAAKTIKKAADEAGKAKKAKQAKKAAKAASKQQKKQSRVPAKPAPETVEPIGARTWRYVGERSKGTIEGVRAPHVEFNVADSVKAYSCPYFQDELSRLTCDTARLMVVQRKDAKTPNGWQFLDDGYPVVNSRMEMVASMTKENMDKAGISFGEPALFAVSRPPLSGDFIKLYALVTDKGREYERDRHKRWSEERCGGPLPDKYIEEIINIDDEDWNGPREIGGVYRIDVVVEEVPTPKGSSAKPHMLIKHGDVVLYEATARNRGYDTFSKHVGEPPITAGYQKLDSIKEQGGYYWKLAIAWNAE